MQDRLFPDPHTDLDTFNENLNMHFESFATQFRLNLTMSSMLMPKFKEDCTPEDILEEALEMTSSIMELPIEEVAGMVRTLAQSEPVKSMIARL